VRNELRSRIFRRFREEGIRMPFPTRTVYLHEPPGQDGSPRNRNADSTGKGLPG
jgi:small-conductance mechanosensitive channel